MSDEPNIFSYAPIEIALDQRLTLRHVRVLIALFSFRSKTTNTVWPKRETLAARCGFPLTRISTITTELARLGWLEKVGSGGRSSPSRYLLTVPNLVTVTKTETVTDLGTKTVTNPVTETVTNPVTRKEQSREQSREDSNIDAYASCRTSPSEAQPAPAHKPCPFEEIRSLWIEVLPELRRPIGTEHWTPQRKAQIRNRWRDQLPDLDAWRKCFEAVRRSRFLMGKGPANGRKPFEADLFWISKPENLLKLYEGKYHG